MEHGIIAVMERLKCTYSTALGYLRLHGYKYPGKPWVMDEPTLEWLRKKGRLNRDGD